MSGVHDAVQWALVGLVIAGYLMLWRMDATNRATQRIQQAARRNVAEQKRAVDQLKKFAADWGHLNEKRAATNARYDDTVTKLRDKFEIKEN